MQKRRRLAKRRKNPVRKVNELLEEATKITPGKRSPTITSLDDGHYKSVSSLVKKDEVSEKMDLLHDIGATDILVFSLTNSRM